MYFQDFSQVCFIWLRRGTQTECPVTPAASASAEGKAIPLTTEGLG